MLAKLLHVANSDPPRSEFLKKRFYAIKNRILHRWATAEGTDLQAFEGKICWSCEGTGGLYEPCGCYKCNGDGWFKAPRIVQLKRWRFGKYVFHEPGLVVWRAATESDNIKFHGRVEHASYSFRSVLISRILLGLIYDRGFAWWYIRVWVAELRTRRCSVCDRRLWSWKTWRCKSCNCRLYTERSDEECPF